MPPLPFEAGSHVAQPILRFAQDGLELLVLQPPTPKCSVLCLGISSCGGGVWSQGPFMSTVLKLGVSPPQSPECMPPTLTPCIGFLFSNKPSFIVVIVTIVHPTWISYAPQTKLRRSWKESWAKQTGPRLQSS